MKCRHLLLKPFIFFITVSVMSHASDAWEKVEQTAVQYSLSRRGMDNRWSAQRWNRDVNLACAMSILCFTSESSSPSHCCWLPRYSKVYTLSIPTPFTITLGLSSSFTMRFDFCTALSARELARERFFFLPHHLPWWTFNPRSVGKERSHLLHLWGNFISATSSSVVDETLSRWWMCIAFVFGREIVIAASSSDPVEMPVSLSEDICTSWSIRAASSANARSVMCTEYGADPKLIPAPGLS